MNTHSVSERTFNSLSDLRTAMGAIFRFKVLSFNMLLFMRTSGGRTFFESLAEIHTR